MFEQFAPFLMQVLLPIIVTLGTLSNISRGRNAEGLYYNLIGILSVKGILDMSDLMQLKLFEPKEDLLDVLTSLLEK